MNTPFKFLDAYTKKEKDIFFGREKEIEELYTRVFQSNLVLLYGASGTGKTSLINCGLANRFSDSDWHAISVRRSGDINQSLRQVIWKQIEEGIKQNKRIQGKPIQVSQENSITELIHFLYLQHFKPIYLIFDQFEELFILGKPGSTDSPSEAELFFRDLANLILSDLNCTVLITLREEYLAWLDEYEKIVPRMMENRMRLESMSSMNVKNVIVRSAEKFNVHLIPEPETNELIFEKVKGEKLKVQLSYLQIYLDQLYRKDVNLRKIELSPDGYPIDKEVQIEFTPELIRKTGSLEEVLGLFIDDQTETLTQDLQNRFPDISENFIWKLLQEFISEEGTKRPMKQKDLVDHLAQRQSPSEKDRVEFAVQKLVQLRILRDLDGIYELGHDSLATLIDTRISIEERAYRRAERMVQTKSSDYLETKVLLTKEELDYIKPFLNRIVLSDEEEKFVQLSQRKVQQNRLRFFLAMALFILISTLAYVAFSGQQEAVKQKKEANQQKRKVELARDSLAQTNNSLDSTVKVTVLQKDSLEDAGKELKKLVKEITAVNLNLDKANDSLAISNHTITLQKDSLVNYKSATELILSAEKNLGIDPKVSLEKAIEANRTYDDPHIYEALYRIYKENKFYKTLNNPVSPFTDMTISLDGKAIATGMSNNGVIIWDHNGKVLAELFGHTDEVKALVFSQDGNTLLSGGRDNMAYVWYSDGRKKTPLKGHTGYVLCVAISPDGQMYATGSLDQSVKLWNQKGEEIGSISVDKNKGKHESYINSVVFSPDGQFILTSSNDQTARIWDLDGREIRRFIGHSASVTKAIFSPDASYVLTSSLDKTARLWERYASSDDDKLVNTEYVRYVGHDSSIFAIAFSPNGNQVLTGSLDHTARLWSLSGDLLHRFVGHTSYINGLAFDQEANRIITASADGTLRVWDMRTNEILQKPIPEGKGKVARFFYQSGNYYVYLDDEAFKQKNKEEIKIYSLTEFLSPRNLYWDLNGNVYQNDPRTTDNLLRYFRSRINGKTYTISQDENRYIKEFILATNRGKMSLYRWKVKQFEKIAEFVGHTREINCLKMSNDRKFLLSGSKDHTIRLWNMEGVELDRFEGHEEEVTDVVFSNDRRFILSVSKDGTLRQWQTLDGFVSEEVIALGLNPSNIIYNGPMRGIPNPSNPTSFSIARSDRSDNVIPSRSLNNDAEIDFFIPDSYNSFESMYGYLPLPISTQAQIHPRNGESNLSLEEIIIKGPKNVEIKAVHSGVVMGHQTVKGEGIQVTISHGTYQTVYLNLDEVYVGAGAEVKNGDLLGTASKIQGSNYGIKFKIMKDGHFINEPEKWFKN